MSPEQVDALVREITESAALAAEEFGDEPSASSGVSVDAISAEDEAVLAFERAMGNGPASCRVVGPPEAQADDATWFGARPSRTARLRHSQAEDRRPYWATEGQALIAAVRWMSTDPRPGVQLLPAEAFASLPVTDTDEAILAAVRAAHRA